MWISKCHLSLQYIGVSSKYVELNWILSELFLELEMQNYRLSTKNSLTNSYLNVTFDQLSMSMWTICWHNCCLD